VPNALAKETSPYLRQHAENPVDWLPWGKQAQARARARDVPLLVSVGYSACHWCHVMERESFEDPGVAALMNERFVCVKVDREEHPDVDALYMEAVQGMTGHGGWPLNVFATPEGVPFYGGTYFPPAARHGMPAWSEVLLAIAELWEERSEEIRAEGANMRGRLAGAAALSPSDEPLRGQELDAAVDVLRGTFDARHGGWGGAPKFPQTPVVEFLLTQRRGQDMALGTLRAMAMGGIRDQVGGGFHRYAVDATWTVPHFEKMLYDNALLARAYLHGFQLTGEAALRQACEDTLDWLARELRGPEGGFYAALDADSQGGEGSFYVWTVAELQAALGGDAAAAIEWFGATVKGNFKGESGGERGLNVLEGRGRQPDTEQRERIQKRLLEVRAQRPRPATDDKRVTSWNALAIAAFAEAGAALERADYLQAAVECAEFVLRELRVDAGETNAANADTTVTYAGNTATKDADTAAVEAGITDATGADPRGATGGFGRLLRTYSGGRARIDGYLEDYAFLLEALVVLFEASCEERWLSEAGALADELIARFADPERGGFFSTAEDQDALVVRRKEIEDAPIPSGSASAAIGLLRLGDLTGEREYERQAVGVLRLVHEIAARHPASFGHTLQALHWYLAPMRPIACAIPPGAGPRPTGTEARPAE
jgi:uncharacterized protein YyaL (SSP411 family)